MNIINVLASLMKRLSSPSPLPAGYTQLNYLESDGTQWLNTGLYINSGTPFKLKFRIVTTTNPPTNSHNGVFGQRATNNSGYGVCYFRYNNVNYLCLYTNTTRALTKPTGQSEWHSTDMLLDVRANGDIYINDELTNQLTFNAFTATGYSRLFKWNWSQATTSITWRIYEFETAGCHLYPAMRDLDSVVGMYDTELNIFRTNQGSGTFVYG